MKIRTLKDFEWDVRGVLAHYDIQIEDEDDKGNLITFCMFHNEGVNPNLSFNEYMNGVYHCLSCNASGNLVTLISEIEKIDNKEAYKKLLRLHEGGKLKLKRKGDHPIIQREEIPVLSKFSLVHKLLNDHLYTGSGIRKSWIKILPKKNVDFLRKSKQLFNLFKKENLRSIEKEIYWLPEEHLKYRTLISSCREKNILVKELDNSIDISSILLKKLYINL